MLVAERKSKIIELVQKKGSVQVEELAKALKVSTMTIRRDLEKLDEEGIIERCHGGAVARTEVAYADKRVSHQEEKEKIALKCLKLVREGDAIYLDAGTTTYEIAKLLRAVPDIMVVTNDLEIALMLKDSSVDLILCGGYVQKSTGSMYGYFATQMMSGFKFNIGFFGAASIDENYHVLTPTVDKAFLKKQVADKCQSAYLAVDDSKFFKEAMIKVSDLTDYTGVITNHQFGKDKEKLLKSGMKIIDSSL